MRNGRDRNKRRLISNMTNAKMAKDIIESVRVNWHYMTEEELTSIYKILVNAKKRVRGEINRTEDRTEGTEDAKKDDGGDDK
jgi:hypothetical protein